MRSNIISLVCVATLGTKNRGTGARREALGGRGFHYLADLVLRSGQTYLGDVVAMGGRPVGRGVGGNRALVHKVEPGASSQVVLIVDWGVEKEA